MHRQRALAGRHACLAALAGVLGGLACAARQGVLPPAVFPLTSSWSADLGNDPIEGVLGSDGTRLYVATRSGQVRAFEHEDGKQVWARPFAPGSTLAAAPAPMPDAEALVVVREPDGRVRRLRPRNGEERWSVDTRVPGHLAPVLDFTPAPTGGAPPAGPRPAARSPWRIYIAGEGIVALDASDGRLVWGAPGTPHAVLPPTPGGARLYVAEADGTLRARDRETGLPLWAHAFGQPLAAPPAADAERVYVGTRGRAFVALGARDGRRRWRWRLGTGVDSAPLLHAGRVLFTSLEGVLYALGRGNGHLAWRATLPSRPLAGPVLVGSAVLVACRETDLAAFHALDGQRLGALKLAQEMRTPPLVQGDRLFVGVRFPWQLLAQRLDLTPRKPQAPAPPGPGGQGRRRATPAAPGPPVPSAPPPSPTATPSPPAPGAGA